MLTYFLSGSNEFTIRTAVTASNSFTMSLQDMLTLENTTASLSGITYNGYESLLGFTASIATNVIADEYRATLFNGGCEIWHGSIQVFTSQSLDKANYTNQIPLDNTFVSNVSENKYVILT